MECDGQSVCASLEEMAAAGEALLSRKLLYLAGAWREMGIMTRADWVRDLWDEGIGRQEMAEALDVSPVTVSYYYKLNWLPAEDQDAVRRGELSTGIAIPKARKLYDEWVAGGQPPRASTPVALPAEPEPVQEMIPVPEPVPAAEPAPDSKAEDRSFLDSLFLPTVQEIDGFQSALVQSKRALPYDRLLFDVAYEIYREWIGYTPPALENAPAAREQEETLLGVLSDPHAPFQHEPTIKAFIDHFRGRNAIGVVSGDLADFFNFSAFPKFVRPFQPIDEFRSAQALLTLMAETFTEVWVIGGNHDARFIKYLVRCGVPPEILDLFDFMAPGFTNPLKLMAKDLPNVHVVEPIQLKDTHASFAFLKQIGDLVLGHAEVYSKIPGRAGTNFAHWLKSFAQPKGLIGEFKVAANGHTHQYAQVKGDYGLWDIELGCSCVESDYVGHPKIQSPRPWVKGFWQFCQVNGITDMNRSRFYCTDDL